MLANQTAGGGCHASRRTRRHYPPRLSSAGRDGRSEGARCRSDRRLDALGFGPRERPSRVVLQQPGLTLKGYGEPTRTGPVILLVPAPIKRAYIWDLAPGASVVEQCLSREARVYFLH
jgi:polyhydroxyalkanoate synthase